MIFEKLTKKSWKLLSESSKNEPRIIIIIHIWHKIDILSDIFRFIRKSFESKLENFKSEIFVFGAKVLHPRSRDENVKLDPTVFSRHSKNLTSSFYALRSSSETHVLKLNIIFFYLTLTLADGIYEDPRP